ncbi:hypothetical protein ACFL21_00115 [Patescibacteria group bacterium]
MIDPIYIGSVGAGIILIAFILGQFHVWKDTYLSYDFMNALGSLLLLWYAYIGHSWPFFVLNGVWAIVSLKDCFTDLRRNARKKGTLGPWEKWMR